MEEYSVIICGAGPAGASCAKALKDEGIEVIILEKERLPRNKMCSGILFGQTQVLLKKYFGALPPDELYCKPRTISAEDIVEWDREKGFKQYVWELPKDGEEFPTQYLNIWRKDFDYWLVNQTGARVLDKIKVNNVEIKEGKVRLIIDEEGKGKREILCDYLIGADGMDSRIRRSIDPTWPDDAQEVPSYQVYYRFNKLGTFEDSHWYVFFEKDIGDVLSCVHRKDDFLTMYVGAFRGRSLKESMRKFKALLEDIFHIEFDQIERDEGCILRLSKPFLGKDKVLLVGDAAGLVYLNGEGISAAIDSGWRAGKAIAQAIKEGKEALSIYQENMADVLNHMQICLKKMHFVVN